MGQTAACLTVEEDATFNVNQCYAMQNDDLVETHQVASNSVHEKDAMFENPMIPNCDLSAIPHAVLPERMSGLNDQECADVLLAQASVRGEIKDVQRALRDGARIDTRAELCIAMGDASAGKPRKLTPLMRACQGGHYEVVQCLLNAKASLWRVDSRGWTPLCFALANCELTLARHLLAESGPHRERQLKMLLAHRDEIIDYCEEWIGSDAANTLHNEFELGFLENHPTKLELLKEAKV
mmetsp:Transcript_21234/g.39947  ORF Transcript_21234/g.39947 Transcript_21234/m.39947 type:complete len:239 (-) Transcript_21234:121-837(-)